ncbi:Hypothetical predicted protein, partial [Paramuricea clavata]
SRYLILKKIDLFIKYDPLQTSTMGQMKIRDFPYESVGRIQIINNIFCRINNICLRPKNTEICMFKLQLLSKFEHNVINRNLLSWFGHGSASHVNDKKNTNARIIVNLTRNLSIPHLLGACEDPNKDLITTIKFSIIPRRRRCSSENNAGGRESHTLDRFCRLHIFKHFLTSISTRHATRYHQKANAHYCHVFKANSAAISDEILCYAKVVKTFPHYMAKIIFAQSLYQNLLCTHAVISKTLSQGTICSDNSQCKMLSRHAPTYMNRNHLSKNELLHPVLNKLLFGSINDLKWNKHLKRNQLFTRVPHKEEINFHDKSSTYIYTVKMTESDHNARFL